MDYEVRNTRLSDLLWLSSFMRDQDRDEVAAASGLTSSAAMIRGHAASAYMKTGLVDGVPVLVFGVAPDPQDCRVGIVWMLATDYLQAPKCKRLLLRHSRDWVARMQDMFPVLANKTDRRNKPHHRWLKWCGFTFINEIHLGPCRAPFLQFVRIKDV